MKMILSLTAGLKSQVIMHMTPVKQMHNSGVFQAETRSLIKTPKNR